MHGNSGRVFGKEPGQRDRSATSITDPPEVELKRSEWWWRQVIVFSIGVAVGLFALWQVQEVRRRRQGGAAKS